MNAIERSYQRCEAIARSSRSSFFRSFQLLRSDRRMGMYALYAFARLADDAIDGSPELRQTWNARAWHLWIDRLYLPATQTDDMLERSMSLASIFPALRDTVDRFQIPSETLHAIVDGVDFDATESPTIETWDQLRSYCHLVASSVGLACVSIWKPTRDAPLAPEARNAAIDCGVAFQLTNIVRDVVEDAQLGRVYLPQQELIRFGLTREDMLRPEAAPAGWANLMRVQFERAQELYDRGWKVIDSISPDSQRMFSLMWHSYRSLLDEMIHSPMQNRQRRIRPSKWKTLGLMGQHLFAPPFLRLMRQQSHRLSRRDGPTSTTIERPFDVEPLRHPAPAARVAIVGGGLAGISAAMHLSRHGVQVELFEAKSRLGGRVGSFVDETTGQPVDYCQHVGMRCCTALRQWIDDTDQRSDWNEADTLFFASPDGQRLAVRAWPLPAPAHLVGLLLRWPGLGWRDRLSIGRALWTLYATKPDASFEQRDAIGWLEQHSQSRRSIDGFWSTILVSALGEQIERVTMGSVHKVLVDGFAADRRAFHLLIPKRPLSYLLNERVLPQLQALGISLQLRTPIGAIERRAGKWFVNSEPFDAIVIAVPWHRVGPLLQTALKANNSLHLSDHAVERIHEVVHRVKALRPSPITGIHTWWDRPWLTQPHAILIQRLCQWIFPGHETGQQSSSEGEPTQGPNRTYYQIVISASRSLPHGDSESILREVRKDLAEVFPEAAVASLLHGRVVTDPYSVFSVDVGHHASRIPSHYLADARLYLAGDWTQSGWPATMEGALRSGALASEHLLSSLHRPASLLADR